MKGKDIVIAICIVIIAGVGIHAALNLEEPATGECQYANNFTDTSGQLWSVTDIQAEHIGCMEAIKVALERGKESVGLYAGAIQLGYEAEGWTCGTDSACTKDESKVTFTLAYEGG